MTVTTPEQIAAPDDATVVLTLEKPTVFALKMMATNVLNIMSDEAIDGATRRPRTRPPTSSSRPIRSARPPTPSRKWTPGVEWELAPNPNYWNAEAVKNGGVLNRTIPSPQERLSLLKNGDVDIAFDLLPKDMADLRNDPNVQLFDRGTPACGRSSSPRRTRRR